MNWVIDLDGVMWRGHQPILGSAEAIAVLQRDPANTVIFATNSSARTPDDVSAQLAAHGVDSLGQVVTSAQAAATLIKPGETVYPIGQKGLRQALDNAGAQLMEGPEVDAVVVGMAQDFNYEMMTVATKAVIEHGARLIATNTDATYPGAEGIYPGNGALVAAIETATGQRAQVAGKPHAPMAELIRSRYGATGICVGDRPDTDGLFALTLGHAFALVLSGVTQHNDLPVHPNPDHVAADLWSLVTALAGN